MSEDKKCAECGATGGLTRLIYEGKQSPWLCPKHFTQHGNVVEEIIGDVVESIDQRLQETQAEGKVLSKKKTDDVRLLPVITKQLACRLTPEELQAYGEQLANTIDEMSNEEARQEGFKKEMKSTLANLQATMTILSSKIRQREERRDVQVQPEMNFKKGVYREIRTDTGDLINERPLSEEERQEALPFEKEPTDKAETATEKKESKPKAKGKKAGKPTFAETMPA
jgi:hypothetical protein